MNAYLWYLIGLYIYGMITFFLWKVRDDVYTYERRCRIAYVDDFGMQYTVEAPCLSGQLMQSILWPLVWTVILGLELVFFVEDFIDKQYERLCKHFLEEKRKSLKKP
jgi:hypothetical protein